MKSLKSSCLKALVLASTLSFSVAFSAENAGCVMGSPVAETKTLVAKILETLKNDQEALHKDFAKVEKDISETLSPKIDINKIALYVTPGTIMKTATADQKEEYNKALLAFFINSYSTAFKSFTKEVSVIVNDLRPGMDKKDTVLVSTVVVMDKSGNPNSKIPVGLVMVRDNANCTWKYVDFCVDNVCAVSNVQSQISSIKAENLVALTKIINDHNQSVLKGM